MPKTVRFLDEQQQVRQLPTEERCLLPVGTVSKFGMMEMEQEPLVWTLDSQGLICQYPGFIAVSNPALPGEFQRIPLELQDEEGVWVLATKFHIAVHIQRSQRASSRLELYSRDSLQKIAQWKNVCGVFLDEDQKIHFTTVYSTLTGNPDYALETSVQRIGDHGCVQTVWTGAAQCPAATCREEVLEVFLSGRGLHQYCYSCTTYTPSRLTNIHDVGPRWEKVREPFQIFLDTPNNCRVVYKATPSGYLEMKSVDPQTKETACIAFVKARTGEVAIMFWRLTGTETNVLSLVSDNVLAISYRDKGVNHLQVQCCFTGKRRAMEMTAQIGELGSLAMLPGDLLLMLPSSGKKAFVMDLRAARPEKEVVSFQTGSDSCEIKVADGYFREMVLRSKQEVGDGAVRDAFQRLQLPAVLLAEIAEREEMLMQNKAGRKRRFESEPGSQPQFAAVECKRRFAVCD